jgi:hypothetical protein
MEDRFAADIVSFDQTHQMWSFLCQKYESTGQSIYIVAIHQEQLLEDRLASYESQFHTYRTWLDEDACAGSVLTASMEDCFAADIIDFEQTHQI